MSKFIVITNNQASSITQAFSDKKKVTEGMTALSNQVAADQPLDRPALDGLRTKDKESSAEIEQNLNNLVIYGSVTALIESNSDFEKYRHYIREAFSRYKLSTYFINDLSVLILKMDEVRAKPKSDKTLKGKKRVRKETELNP